VPNNRERITRALDALTTGLFPFVERKMKAVYKDSWHEASRGRFREGRGQVNVQGNAIRWDMHTLLTVMWDHWNRVFCHCLGPAERSLISELREFRNRWAHQEEFHFDDAYRILDSVHRLLVAVSAREAEAIARDKHDLLRRHFSREARLAYQNAQFTRRKWLDFAVYLVCCLSLVFVILQFFGTHASFLAAFFIAIFMLLIQQRVSSPSPMYFCPRECDGCGKIIYGDACPYCEFARDHNPLQQSVLAPSLPRRQVRV